MEDLSRFCCQNRECSGYGKRGAGNLTVCDHYGRDDSRRVLRCRICKARFSERNGTPFFNSNLSDEDIVGVYKHLQGGCGIRQTARLTGVSRKTVGRLVALAGGHAQALHEEFVAFSPSDP